MHDLLFNDLGGTIDGGLDLNAVSMQTPGVGSWDTAGAAGGGGGDAQWQFEGDFGNDSFWGFMNTYSS